MIGFGGVGRLTSRIRAGVDGRQSALRAWSDAGRLEVGTLAARAELFPDPIRSWDKAGTTKLMNRALRAPVRSRRC